MKVLFSLVILSLTLFLFSCSTLNTIDVIGDEHKDEYKIEAGDTLYIANRSSRTFHLSSCYIANRIKEENRYETYNLTRLIERGFAPCKTCMENN